MPINYPRGTSRLGASSIPAVEEDQVGLWVELGRNREDDRRRKKREKKKERKKGRRRRWTLSVGFSLAFLLIYVPIPIHGKRQLISRHYRPYVISRRPDSNVSRPATSLACRDKERRAPRAGSFAGYAFSAVTDG